jgi:hypothetical protein
MPRGREVRLRRLVQRAAADERAALEGRERLRARAAIGAAVRTWLTQAGIEAARAEMLRLADEAAAEPAAAAAEPGERASPQGDLARLDPRLGEETGRLVARYRHGDVPDPDPAHASLAELFAWCLARQARLSGSDFCPPD